jgi:ribosomal protein S18 acetylase RimI-like enzyme
VDIIRVKHNREWRAFVEFPYRFYKDDPLWIPPLRLEQKRLFNRHKNSMLANCDYELFLAIENTKPVGRAAAFVDHHYNAHWNERTGFFGSFESINDQQVAFALLRSCERWLNDQHMDNMRGPISFESQNWGVNMDDYESPSRLMSPYNPPYYGILLQGFGLEKCKDLEIFAASTQNYPIPERFLRHKEWLFQKYNLNIRPIDMKNLDRDVGLIVDLSNRSLSNNWGYAPISESEAEAIARDLKPIVWPELVRIVESNHKPIGFSITLPDILQLLKGCNGHLFPDALFRLLFKLRTIRVFRIWALGIVPEFQRKGIDTLLYLSIWEALRDIDAYVEANYVLEDNYAMKDAVLKLGMDKVRTVRIYEKKIENTEV